MCHASFTRKRDTSGLGYIRKRTIGPYPDEILLQSDLF